MLIKTIKGDKNDNNKKSKINQKMITIKIKNLKIIKKKVHNILKKRNKTYQKKGKEDNKLTLKNKLHYIEIQDKNQ